MQSKVAVALLLLCFAFAATVTVASDVIVLDEENFDEQVFATGSKDWMIKFYAPWCGHCRRLEPTWEAFAKQTKGRLNVAKVDATENEELAALYEIAAYPTIIFISNGKMKDYVGQREKDDFVAFGLLGGHEEYPAKPAPRTHEEVVEPAVPKVSDVIVLSANNFSQALSKGKWLVEFYAPWCGHCKNLAPEWERLATDAKLEGLNVAKVDATQEGSLAILFEIKGYPTIKYFPGNGQYYDYSGPRLKKEFLQFSRTGFELAAPHPVPSETSAAFYKVLHEVYEKIEPYAKLAIQDYLGVSFIVLTVLALAVGFLFGRITASPTRVYVLSQEEYDKLKKLREQREKEAAAGDNSGKKKKGQGKKEENLKTSGNNNNNNNKKEGGQQQQQKQNNNNNKKQATSKAEKKKNK